MKNTQVFHTIEELVQAKKKKIQPQKPSFAHNYCTQQIQKKKLVPFNPNSKMNTIMKNFYQLDTYVNVQKLVNYINQLISERKKQVNKSETNIRWNSKKEKTVYSQEIAGRIKQKLGDYYHKKHMGEHKQVWETIKSLQKNFISSNHRNASSHFEYQQLWKSIDKYDQNCTQQKIKSSDRWNFYHDTIHVEPIQNQKPKTKRKCKRENLKQSEQRKQLIHQVSTYLQIILENRHKKKWGSSFNKTNNNHSQDRSSTLKQQNKEQINLKTPLKRNNSERSSIKILSYAKKKVDISEHTTIDNSFSKSFKRSHNTSPINCFKNKQNYNQVKDQFTFRNRNIKQRFMKKLENFVDIVQQQQKALKKQKNIQLAELGKIQSRISLNTVHSFTRQMLAQDKQITALLNKVKLQK